MHPIALVPLIVAAVVAIAPVAPAALAAPGVSDRIGPGSTPSSTQLRDRLADRRMVLSTGAYAIVEARSAVSTSHEHLVQVRCPAGLKAMSAGFAAPSSRGEPPDWRVILSQPQDDGGGWTVHGVFDGSGGVDYAGVRDTPTAFEWRLRVRVVCALL